MPIVKNNKLGIHTAQKGDMAPFTEKEVDKVEKTMYVALNASPIPKCKPTPPLTLREASETPINVMIKAANGIANRL